MEDLVNIDKLKELSDLASQFGPFFFTILYLLVVTRQAHKWYSEVSKENPQDPTRKSIYKHIMIWSSVFGAALTIVSISYFFYQAFQYSTYQIAITDIQPKIIKLDSSYYYKQQYRPVTFMDSENNMKVDNYFLIVQDHPFHIGDPFVFHVWISCRQSNSNFLLENPLCQKPEDSIQKKVVVKYNGRKQDSYRLEITATGDPKLLANNTPSESVFSVAEINHALQIAKYKS